MQTKIFPPKEVAMELKRVGYNWECIAYYINMNGNETTRPFVTQRSIKNANITDSAISCTAPTYDQVIGWFAEVHKMDISIYAGNDVDEYITNIWIKGDTIHEGKWHDNRQQSLLTAFKEAIKLIQKCQEEAK